MSESTTERVTELGVNAEPRKQPGTPRPARCLLTRPSRDTPLGHGRWSDGRPRRREGGGDVGERVVDNAGTRHTY